VVIVMTLRTRRASYPAIMAAISSMWVTARPEFRKRGLVRQLLEATLELGAARGLATAHVATYLGNEPAISAYRSVGFEFMAEVRHVDYESKFGAPGSIYFRRRL
jgi:ribosomal protein S18 acetylase RimI-like enzyme